MIEQHTYREQYFFSKAGIGGINDRRRVMQELGIDPDTSVIT